MTQEAKRMAETALASAQKALELGHKNSSDIAVLHQDLQGHKETCEANQKAIDEKLDLIIRILMGLVKYGGLVLVSVILGWIGASKIGLIP